MRDSYAGEVKAMQKLTRAVLAGMAVVIFILAMVCTYQQAEIKELRFLQWAEGHYTQRLEGKIVELELQLTDD